MRPTIILISAFVAAVAAQTPEDVRANFGAAMKQNAEALKQYSYKRRTEVIINGQSRGARVELIRCVDGRMETVALETPARSGESARGGRLRAGMQQKKREEMSGEIESLNNLMRSYVSFDSDSMHTALKRATVAKDRGPEADLQVSAKGIVKPSDSLTLTWSVANHRPQRIEIRTDLDGKPVSAVVEYAALPDGPFYVAHTVISQPKKNISITMDTFDYTRDNGAK